MERHFPLKSFTTDGLFFVSVATFIYEYIYVYLILFFIIIVYTGEEFQDRGFYTQSFSDTFKKLGSFVGRQRIPILHLVKICRIAHYIMYMYVCIYNLNTTLISQH